MVFQKAKLQHLVAASLIIYLTLHLLEEWIGGFPAWAETYWHIPNYTVAKWLLHNVYFAAALGAGYLIYRSNPETRLPFGLGIVVWGGMNSLSHIVCSFIFASISPGIWSGLAFLVIAVLVWQRLTASDRFTWRLAGLSLLLGLVYWTLPIVSFITVDRALGF